MLSERIQSPKIMDYLIFIKTKKKKKVKENKSVVARVWSKRRVVQRNSRREGFLGNDTFLCPDCGGGGYMNLNVLEFIEMHTKRFSFIVC